jgi:hypothetical protein
MAELIIYAPSLPIKDSVAIFRPFSARQMHEPYEDGKALA